MILKNRKALKSAAAVTLSRASCNPKKLALIHSGVLLGVSLLLLVIDYVTNHVLANFGGLSAMTVQAMASSSLTMMNLTVTLLTPVWSAGFLLCTLKWVRGEAVGPKDLKGGFSRFLPLLKLTIAKGLMTVAVVIISCYAALMVFTLTPLSNGMTDLIAPFLTEEAADIAVIMEQIPQDQLMQSLIPFYPLALGAFAFLYYIFLYRLRFAEYFILDHRTDRAKVAMALSTRLLHRRKKDLLKLDLSFWWYYVATALLAIIGYLDVILAFVGMPLPFDPAVNYFVPFLLYIAGTLLLEVHALPYMQTVYTESYCRLTEPKEEIFPVIDAE